MIFQRTPQGLSNLHMFYDVDYIVYTEGSFDPDQSPEYRQIDVGYDCSFWSSVFSALSNKSVRVFSKGSKSNLVQHIDYIKTNNIQRVIVALDRDFDELKGKLINENFVIYTRGYSWESDVVSELNISPIFYSICPTCRASYNPVPDYQSWLQKVSEALKRFSFLDFTALSNSEKLFDRSKPESILTKNRNQLPSIDRAYTLKKFQELKERVGKPNSNVPYNIFSPELHFYGKSYSSLIYRWLTYQANRVGALTKITKSGFHGMAISSFEEWLKSNTVSPLASYFLRHVTRVIGD